MDMIKIATQLLMSKMGGSAGGNNDLVQSVIGKLLGGSSDGGEGGMDLGSIVGNLESSGLGGIAKSWLGDGDNEEISAEQLESALGSDKIQEAASALGADSGDLLAGLKDMLPQVVDKSSSGGSLLDSVGGLGGLASLAGKFLK